MSKNSCGNVACGSTIRPYFAGSNAMRQSWTSGVGRLYRPTNDSYRVDETYIKIKKQWHYLYRAVDSTGATLERFSN